MILVTGPTGSGKTTTLYAALEEINSPQRKIITVEDPVEYRLPRINQVQVQEKIELSFGRILRSALRQDPDVILVGEMRDQETVEVGLRAAMTGHMVLSTLHTNDAISTPMRLLDMGAPRYMVAMSLHLVLAQRLVRMICESCIENHQLLVSEREWLRHELGDRVDDFKYRRGTGCSQCNNTGYLGRSGVYEMLEMTRPVVEAANSDDGAALHAGRSPADARTFVAATCRYDGFRRPHYGRGSDENFDAAGSLTLAYYLYKGRDTRGELVQGVLEAPDSGAVATQLFGSGITPVEIGETSRPADVAKKSLNLFQRKIEPVDLMLFSRQMYSLLKAGVPILRALGGLQESSFNPAFKEALRGRARELGKRARAVGFAAAARRCVLCVLRVDGARR